MRIQMPCKSQGLVLHALLLPCSGLAPEWNVSSEKMFVYGLFVCVGTLAALVSCGGMPYGMLLNKKLASLASSHAHALQRESTLRQRGVRECPLSQPCWCLVVSCVGVETVGPSLLMCSCCCAGWRLQIPPTHPPLCFPSPELASCLSSCILICPMSSPTQNPVCRKMSSPQSVRSHRGLLASSLAPFDGLMFA